jgi:hypothetical protein
MNVLDSKLRLPSTHKDLTHSSLDGSNHLCGSMGEFTNNWLVFPYHHESVLNLRFISTKSALPTINKTFIRTHYNSDIAFEAATLSAAIRGNELGYNIYQCVNQINNDFSGEAVSDNDIFSIDKLFIDIDRAGNTKSPATDVELSKSMNYVRRLVDYLITLGWPKPNVVMSGNGYHVYYELDEDALEPTESNRALRRAVLNCLADEFDTPDSIIDRGVYNGSRITKVLGMLARKGEASDERPYRLVHLVSKPSIYYFVTNSMMQSLVDDLGAKSGGAEDSIRAPRKVGKVAAEPETPRQIARIKEMLNFIDADCSRSVWLEVVWGLLSTRWTTALQIAEDWSKTAPHRFNEGDFATLVSSFDEDYETSYTLATVVYRARLGGWGG